jgi:O-antigen/teichoic acid export membrane protein
MLREFFESSAIYIIPNFLTRFSGFLLLIFYTRFLTPSEYGVIELILVLFSLLNLLLPLEVTQGVARFFSNSNKEEKSEIISTSILFTAFVFLLPIIFVLLFAETISHSLFEGQLGAILLIILCIYMLFLSLQKLIENQLRWSLRPREYTYLSLFGTFTLLSLPVTLIYYAGMRIDGYLIGCLISSFLTTSYGLYLINKTNVIRLSFNKKTLSRLLKFSSPLVLSSAAFYIFSYSDRWMLQYFESSETVGIYGAASRIASLAAILHVLSRYSFMPLIYAKYEQQGTARDVGDIFTQAIFLGAILSSCIFLFKEEITSLVLGENFSRSSEIIGLMSISIILMNSYFFLPGLGIAKRTFMMASISVFVAVLNIIGNFLLIPILSITGAAISSLIASLSMVLLYFFLGQREYKIDLNYFKILFLLSICFVLTAYALLINEDLILGKFICILIMLLTYLSLSKSFLLNLLANR